MNKSRLIILIIFIFFLFNITIFTLNKKKDLVKEMMDIKKILDEIDCLKDGKFNIYSNFLLNIPIETQLVHGGIQNEAGIDTIAETISYAYDIKKISVSQEQIVYLWLESTVYHFNDREATLKEAKIRINFYKLDYKKIMEYYKIAIAKKIKKISNDNLRVPKLHTTDFIKALIEYYQNLGEYDYLKNLVKVYHDIPLRNSRFKIQKFLAIDLNIGVYNSLRNEYKKMYNEGFDND